MRENTNFAKGVAGQRDILFGNGNARKKQEYDGSIRKTLRFDIK